IRNDDSRNDSNAIGLTPGYLDPNNQSIILWITENISKYPAF
ncbi:14244_t:CDS:2, partial [Entrophospora sp. SA101]